MGSIAQRSFAAGEITPALYARTDLARYLIGLRTCRNMQVLRQGGVANRQGTEFVCAAKNSAAKIRIAKFAFNISQTFILEFGDKYIRFIQNGGQVVVSGVAAWSGATNYVVDDLVVSGGVNYYCILAHINHIPANATYWYPLSGNIYEIPSPYLVADVGDLNMVQSADVVTIVHPSYPVYDLKRYASTKWTMTAKVFGPNLAIPTGVNLNPVPGAGTLRYKYAVTAVDTNGDESYVGVVAVSALYADPTAAVPHSLRWNTVFDPTTGGDAGGGYNIYLSRGDSDYGLIGSAAPANVYPGLAGFSNPGITPDFTKVPPRSNTFFAGASDYPSVAAYYQQRLLLAGTNNAPARIWASRTGQYNNFTDSLPIQDDDAINFTLVSDEVDSVRHILNLGKLVIGTDGSEWLAEGDSNGVLTPFAVNARIGSYNGSAKIKPVKVDNTILYVQASGNKVLELKTNILAGYYTFTGSDLTLFSTHLFDGYTVTDWDYQQIPGYTVWAVRSDGTLLGLTYIADQEMQAWHRHDTDGSYENVCVVTENGNESVYVVVKRTINGVTKRYIERFRQRFISDNISDPGFMDSSLVYEGRNAGSFPGVGFGATMTLSGGTAWDDQETLTLTASAVTFAAGWVGDEVWLHGSDGTIIKFKIAAYISTTVVTGHVNKIVPAAMRSAALATWDHAVPAVGGLSHLEAKKVSIYADGYVVASPNNSKYPVRTVASGIVTFGEAHAYVRVGLPFISDFETLDIDTPSGPTLKESKFAITKVGLFVEKSRGIWQGLKAPTGTDPLEGLTESKLRDSDDNYDPTTPLTGFTASNIEADQTDNGRVFVRQVDPLPLTILSATPMGFIPGPN